MKRPKSDDERVPTVSWLPCAPMPDTSRTSVSLKTVADHLAEMDDEPRSKPPRRLCISPETRQALESADKLLANAERLLSQMNFKDVPLDISDDGSNCEKVNDEELYIRNVVASTFQKGYYEPGPSAILDKDDFKIKHEKMAGAKRSSSTQEASRSTWMARARSNSPTRGIEPCLVCHSQQVEATKPLEKTEEKKIQGKPALNVQKAPPISISGECFSVQAANIIDIEPQEQSQTRSCANVATFEIKHESKKADIAPTPVVEQERKKSSTPTVAASQTDRGPFEQADEVLESTIVEQFDEDDVELNASLGEPGVLAEVDNLLDQQRMLIKHVCKASEKLDQFLMMNGSSLDTDSSPEIGNDSRVSLQKKTANEERSETRQVPRIEIDLASDKSRETTSSRAKTSRESSRNKSLASVESLPSKSGQSSACQDESGRATSRNDTYDLVKASSEPRSITAAFGSGAQITEGLARTNSGFITNLKVPVALKDDNSSLKKLAPRNEREPTRSESLERDHEQERVNKEKKNEADCDVMAREDDVSSSSIDTENRDSRLVSRESPRARGQKSSSSSTSFSENEHDRSADEASENSDDLLRLMHVSHFEHRSVTPDQTVESGEKSQLEEELSTESKIENSLQEARENLKRVMKAMDDDTAAATATAPQTADFANGPSDTGPLSRHNRSMVEILEESSRLKSNERRRLSLLKNLESCSIDTGIDRCAVKGLFTSTLIGDAGLANNCSKLKITDTSSDVYSEGEVCLSSATTSSLSLGEVRRKIQLTKSKSTTSSSNATSSTSAARSLGELAPPTH